MEVVKKEEVCRLCLGDQPWLHIFDESFALAEKVESLCRFKIAPDDSLPKYICSPCAETLDAAIAFRDRCEASDDRLRRQLDEPQDVVCNVDPLNFLAPFGGSGSGFPKPKRKHKKANKFNEICPFCGLSFNESVPYEHHLRTHSEKPFACGDCDKTYADKKRLAIHIKTHRLSLQCEICGRRFGDTTDIRRHINATHRLGDTFECDICQCVFYRKQALSRHMVSHQGIKEFKCDLCGLCFTSKGGRAGHMRTHTGEKPFACSSCGASFAARRTLMDHVRLHTGETPHHCPVCDKGFVQLSNMKSHFRNNHKGVPFIYQNKRTAFPRYNTIKDHVTYENDREKCK